MGLVKGPGFLWDRNMCDMQSLQLFDHDASSWVTLKRYVI
jgi:hypothetical protein